MCYHRILCYSLSKPSRAECPTSVKIQAKAAGKAFNVEMMAKIREDAAQQSSSTEENTIASLTQELKVLKHENERWRMLVLTGKSLQNLCKCCFAM